MSTFNMASLKCKARLVVQEKEISLTESVMELSITLGHLCADVHVHQLNLIDTLKLEHCISGIVALVRDEQECHLHMQMVVGMVVRSRTKSAIGCLNYLLGSIWDGMARG